MATIVKGQRPSCQYSLSLRFLEGCSSTICNFEARLWDDNEAAHFQESIDGSSGLKTFQMYHTNILECTLMLELEVSMSLSSNGYVGIDCTAPDAISVSYYDPYFDTSNSITMSCDQDSWYTNSGSFSGDTLFVDPGDECQLNL